MESLIKDIRYGFRNLMKRPGFTAVAVVTLALGIGANTAIFSLISTVLLRPLPVPHPEQLVEVYGTTHHGPGGVLIGFGAARLIVKLLFGVNPADPITFVGVTLLLGLVAALACYIPARRATKVDPLVALRYE